MNKVVIDAEAIFDDKQEPERVLTVQKSLQLLEVIAASGGSTAKQLSDMLGYPLPTVYRLAHELVASGYLVHLRSERRFELGYKVYDLGRSLHQRLGASPAVRTVIDSLRGGLGMAAYYAVFRGADVVLTYVSDSAEQPRLSPLKFGFHEAAHATAFGKIMLAAMTVEQRDEYLNSHGAAQLAPSTITDRSTLERALISVTLSGIAWERNEFIPGKTCAAVGLRDLSGHVVGAVAVSMDSDPSNNDAKVERALRESAALLSMYHRAGGNQLRLRTPA